MRHPVQLHSAGGCTTPISLIKGLAKALSVRLKEAKQIQLDLLEGKTVYRMVTAAQRRELHALAHEPSMGLAVGGGSDGTDTRAERITISISDKGGRTGSPVITTKRVYGPKHTGVPEQE